MSVTTKNFDVIYTRNGESESNTVNIVMDTDGDAGDWYPRLFSRLRAIILDNDYHSDKYIDKLTCYDGDHECYSIKDYDTIVRCGMYFEYTREDELADGYWVGQTPLNACYCQHIMSDDIGMLCDCAKDNDNPKDEQYLGTGLPNIFKNLFLHQDHGHPDVLPIRMAEIPDRKEVLQTLDDCKAAFDWIHIKINENYLNVPDEWNDWANNIQQRLNCVKHWVAHSTPQQL